MQLTRRQFGTTSLATMASAALWTGLPAIEGCTTNWIDVAIADLPVIVGIADQVVAIVGIADPGLDPSVSALIKIAALAASSGLAELKVLITDYNTNPSATLLGKIKAAVLAIQKNFTDIVAQFSNITSSKLVATLAQAGSLALSVLSAILALLPASGVMLSKGSPHKLLTAKEIKSQFNSVAVANGYVANQIQ